MKKNKKELMIMLIIILIGVLSMYAISLRAEQINKYEGVNYERNNY